METFYFVIFTNREETTLKVIDLAYSVDYQRNDWNVVDKKDFQDRDQAIAHAKDLALKHGLKYERFESRYNSALNEPKMSLS